MLSRAIFSSMLFAPFSGIVVAMRQRGTLSPVSPLAISPHPKISSIAVIGSVEDPHNWSTFPASLAFVAELIHQSHLGCFPDSHFTHGSMVNPEWPVPRVPQLPEILGLLSS